MPSIKNTTAPSGEFELLRVPPLHRQDLVIVGGGPAGITAAMRLVHEMEQSRTTNNGSKLDEERFKDLSGVTLLAGGNSLAFSPGVGEFGKFLTLYGSELRRRDETLQGSRNFVQSKFASHNFNFKRNEFARSIEVSRDKRFIIATDSGKSQHEISARKLILAIGHSLKERPAELDTYLFRGTNDLCTKLQSLLPGADSQEDCLDQLLARFRRTSEGAVRIGLVGLGATFLEAIKIFHALLDPPQHDGDVYRTRGSRTPVEFLLYDDRLKNDTCATKALVSAVRNFHSHISDSPTPDTLLTADGVKRYKAAEIGRIEAFVQTGQLDTVPERFNWETTKIVDDMVIASSPNGRCDTLSCIVDCSPFNAGINHAQRKLLAKIPSLTFHENQDGTFTAEQRDTGGHASLALVGAAFAPKERWGLGTMNEHGINAIETLFPRLPLRTPERH